MSLILNSQIVGEPNWAEIPVGNYTTSLTQYYDVRSNPRQWRPVPWITKDKFIVKMGANYRIPVTFKAKIQALWAAKSTLFKRYILRRKLIKGE